MRDGAELELHRWLPILRPYVDHVVIGWLSTDVPTPMRGLDSAGSVLAEVRLLLPSDRDRLQAAWALVQIMEGEMGGSSSDEAQAASLLYEGLSLPPGPVAALLRSVRTPLSAKRAALSALRGSAFEPEVKEAARTVVCELAAKADGVLRAAGISEPVRDEYLADDEADLVSAIGAVYSTNEDQAGRMLDYLSAGLSVSNPVVWRLRTALGVVVKEPGNR